MASKMAAALRALADHVPWSGDVAGEALVRELADDLDTPDTDDQGEVKTDAREDAPKPAASSGRVLKPKPAEQK